MKQRGQGPGIGPKEKKRDIQLLEIAPDRSMRRYRIRGAEILLRYQAGALMATVEGRTFERTKLNPTERDVNEFLNFLHDGEEPENPYANRRNPCND